MGTIYRRKDGYGAAAISPNGTRLVRLARTRREAQDKLNHVLRTYRLGVMDAPSKLKLAEFVDWWLETVQQDLKPTTLDNYQRLCAGFILPILGSVNLHDLRPYHIIPALAQWRKWDVSSVTVPIAYRCLHRILTCAVKWGMLPLNPRQRLEASKVKRKESKV
jgi:hypothetical protein